jgi:two-component sensor histidine kinase
VNEIKASNVTPFDSEVASRFGLVPNFFRTAGDAPGLIEELWGFAKSAYLDNPFPSLFKERLFVHLSRFCEVRYCIVRHVGFLVGNGNPAGNPNVTPNTLEQVIDLLRRPGVPGDAEVDAALTRLELAPQGELPLQDMRAEEDVFIAATILFLTPSRSARARDALRNALGAPSLELLTAFLAFIRTAHYWTVTHSDLVLEDDMNALLHDHETLAALLLNDPESSRSEVGSRLYDELILLRRERDDRAELRRALSDREQAQKRQQLLINELNHRVKNTLAIVQSIASQTLRGSDVSPSIRDALVARLFALAQAHDLLTEKNWEGAQLNDVLVRATRAHAADEERSRITLAGPEIRLTPKQALSFAMVAHELATNAAKYGALSTTSGQVAVQWEIVRRDVDDWLSLEWRESGGPTTAPPTKKGFGTRMIERGLAAELEGKVTLSFDQPGLVCAVIAPLPRKQEFQ